MITLLTVLFVLLSLALVVTVPVALATPGEWESSKENFTNFFKVWAGTLSSSSTMKAAGIESTATTTTVGLAASGATTLTGTLSSSSTMMAAGIESTATTTTVGLAASGATTLTSTLSVSGETRIADTMSANGVFVSGTATFTTLYVGSTQITNRRRLLDATDEFDENSDGVRKLIHVGNISSSGTLRVVDIFASGAITAVGTIAADEFFTSSDSRLKANVRPLSDRHLGLLELSGVSYKWRAGPGQKPRGGAGTSTNGTASNGTDGAETPTKKTYFGFLAQNVRDHFPELVNTDPAGWLSVNYVAFVPLLVEALKEQSTVVAQQQEHIVALTGAQASLERRLRALEAGPQGPNGHRGGEAAARHERQLRSSTGSRGAAASPPALDGQGRLAGQQKGAMVSRLCDEEGSCAIVLPQCLLLACALLLTVITCAVAAMTAKLTLLHGQQEAPAVPPSPTTIGVAKSEVSKKQQHALE
jgi:photosystem II core protein PsbZ